MSGRNPFRSPAQGGATVRSPSPPLPPLPQRIPSQTRPALPPRSLASSQPEVTTTSSSEALSRSPPPPEVEDIDDDLPPPYTLTANAGEETVGLGPRRPFQQPPLLPPPSVRPIPDQRPQTNWTPQPYPTGTGSSSGYYARPGLAPWQTHQQYRQRQKGGGGLIGALLDTVRDIADVVSGAHDERFVTSQSANASAYAAPYSSRGAVYAPPPGPPGQVRPPPPPPPASPRRPASAPPHSPPPIPDDGSPTRTPVPGHPLLRDGNLLVYPRDHLCVKCKNTGYKNYDPSNPCRKCWDKYGRPYTGALTYTPWSPSGNDPRMQRSLPRFVPPHLAGTSPESPYWSGHVTPPPRHPHHNRSISQPQHVRSPPPAGPSYYVLNPFSTPDAPPVPHAIPVEPGDPRLGGRLCMRCGGTGVRTVMLIDVMMCDSCGGTGRDWS